MFNKNSKLARMAGYTIDQTILIVAVIAILITLVIASVGWDILTRTGGTKFASNLRQMEDSTGLFFSDNGNTWPATTDALITGDKVYVGLRDEDTAAAGDLLHEFGAGGTITLGAAASGATAATCPGTAATYITYTYADVPEAEAERAQQIIDGIEILGSVVNAEGRVRWAASGGVGNDVDVLFCSNQQ